MSVPASLMKGVSPFVSPVAPVVPAGGVGNPGRFGKGFFQDVPNVSTMPVGGAPPVVRSSVGGVMSVPAGQMGGLQGAVNSGRYLSQGSSSAKDLLARLWAAANLPGSPSQGLGGLSRPQNLAYRQAAQQALPIPRTMLSSVLGHAGLMPRGDPRFRNMGSGVRPSPEAIAASYGLSGYQPSAPVSAPPVPSGPPAGFQGAYAGPPASGSGGPMGVPTPVDPYAQLTAAMLNPQRGAWGRRVYR